MATPLKITATVVGGAVIERNLERYFGVTTKKLAKALETAGYRVHEVVEPLVPIDTGNLRESRYVASRTSSKETPTVAIGFSAHYAATVHERTEIAHPVGQAKFLEIGVKQAAPSIASWVAAAMQGRLVAGAGLKRLAAADVKAHKLRHPERYVSAKAKKSKVKLDKGGL